MAEKPILFMRKDKSKIGTKSDEDGDSTTAEDDIWDDTALVQAYDRAVSLAKEEVALRMGLSKRSVSGNESNTSSKTRRRRRRRNKKEWRAGDQCRALYSEDGVWYEATVDCVYPDRGTCKVTYVGYNNVEEVPVRLLEPSLGPTVRQGQELEAAREAYKEADDNSLEMDLSDGDSRPGSAQHNKMNWEPNSSRPPDSRFMPHSFRSPRMPSMAVPPMVVPPPPPPHLLNSFPEDDAEALSAMLMSWYMSGFHTGYYQGLKQAKTLAPSGGDFSRNSSRKK